jgi:hypothetical protein
VDFAIFAGISGVSTMIYSIRTVVVGLVRITFYPYSVYIPKMGFMGK